MKVTVILCFFMLALLSCSKDTTDPSYVADGMYSGMFLRSSPNAKYAPSNVTLTLLAGKFSGHADVGRYPEICSGTYHIVGQEIEFNNECFFTADFDWSLILNGKFTFTINGKSLVLSKASDGVSDMYSLTLQ